MSQNCRLSRSDRGGLARCRVPGHIPPLLGSVCIWCCLPAQVYNRQRWAIEIHSGSVPALFWKAIWAEGEDRRWPAGPSASSEPAIWAPPEWRRAYVTHTHIHTHTKTHTQASSDSFHGLNASDPRPLSVWHQPPASNTNSSSSRFITYCAPLESQKCDNQLVRPVHKKKKVDSPWNELGSVLLGHCGL